MYFKRIVYPLIVCLFFLSTLIQANSQPTFSITPLTSTQIDMPRNAVARAEYQIKNNTNTTRLLTMRSLPGISVVSGGSAPACTMPFTLGKDKFCILTLALDGSALGERIVRPTICATANGTNADSFLCSQSSWNNSLFINFIPPAVQLAVGVNNDGAEPVPLLTQSNDGGESWSVVDVSQAPEGGQFFNTVCAGARGKPYCFAGGGTPDDASRYTVPPFIFSTVNSSSTWAPQNISGAPELGNLYGVACNSSASICVATGDSIFYTDSTITSSPPLIVQSLDYGKNWAVKALSGNNIPDNASFISASCVDEDSSKTFCVSSGQIAVTPGVLNSNLNNPLLAQTVDSGLSWTIVDVPDAPATGYFYHVDCTQHANRVLCATIGQDYESTSPVIAQTTDTGGEWRMIPVSTGSTNNNGYLNDIACLGSMCVAVGTTFTTSGGTTIYQPFMYQTKDGGKSWAKVEVEGISSVSSGMFYTVHCTGSGEQTLCVTGGANYGTETPLLAQTTNKGASWSVVPLQNAPLGFFNTVSCTGEGSTAVCNAVGVNDNAGLSNSAPLIAQTRNGGLSWSIFNSNTISNLPTLGAFYWSAATGG